MLNVAGISCRGGLEDQHVHFIIGNRPVLHTSSHDDELSLCERHDAVSKLHPERTAYNEKQLIVPFVLMPHELALELDELHFLSVQLADNFGPPILPIWDSFSARFTFCMMG